ncbi:MAG: HU family DNA-binding protein [Ruminococcus sp.]|nr:HU family DNA-binding protein [Ruminococcus sp.]
MKKAELIAAIAEKNGGTTKKSAEQALDAVISTIAEALEKGDKVAIPGFGTFEVRDRAAKKSINPATKEPFIVPAKKVPAFKAAKALKENVDKKNSKKAAKKTAKKK